jgi:hypothetical protein
MSDSWTFFACDIAPAEMCSWCFDVRCSIYNISIGKALGEILIAAKSEEIEKSF